MTLEQKIEQLIITRRLAGKFNVGSAVVAHALVDENNNQVVPSFLATQTASVDPSGDDTTGVVGDLLRPFLTVQGAINAFEAGDFISPLIDVGCADLSEDVTTALRYLILRAPMQNFGTVNSITFTSDQGVSFDVIGGRVSGVTCAGTIGIGLFGGASIFGTTTSTAGWITLTTDPSAIIQGTISVESTGHITLIGLTNPLNAIDVDAPLGVITAKLTLLRNVVAAATLNLIDARVSGTNGATSTVYADVLLANLHPSILILPTSDPHVTGALWNDAETVTVSTG